MSLLRRCVVAFSGTLLAGLLGVPKAAAEYTGPVNPLPAQIGAVGFSQSGQPNDASLARTGGKTYFFTPTSVSPTAAAYWGPAPNGIKESFVRNPPVGAEIFSYSHSPAANVGIWTGQTNSPTNNAVVHLRFTLTARNQGGSAYPLTTAASLGLPASVGLVAPVTQGVPFSAHFIFEASSNVNGPWQPALEFFDAIPFKSPALSGTAQTSFSSGYYYELTNTAPTITAPASTLTNRNTPTPALAFSVADNETPGALVVTAASNNQSVVADADIAISGTGLARTVVVTPVTDAHGSAVITLTVSDGELTDTAQFTVTVNQPPRLNANTPLAVIQGASATLTPAHLRASDTVSSEEELTFTIAPGGVGSAPHYGILEKVGAGPIGAGETFTMADITAGLIRYVSDGNVTPGDSFQFGVTDHQGGVAYDVTFTTFTFAIQVTIVNQAPKGSDATYQGGLGAPVSAVLGATDVDSTEFTFAITDGPENGTITSFDAETGAFVYVPNDGFIGSDTFAYTVADDEYTSAPKTITIVVANQPPSVEDVAFEVFEGATFAGEVVAADPDLPPQTLIFAIEDAPLHGIAAFTGEGAAFTYTSTPGYFGADEFTYSVSDGINPPVIATATVTIRPVLSVGRILLADPNGRQIVLVDHVNGLEAVITKDELLLRPVAVALRKSGSIVVLDQEAGLLSVNPATGEQTALVEASEFPVANEMVGRNALAQEADGNLLVSNAESGVVRVNATTGEVTSLSSGLFAVALAIGPGGEIYASDVGLFTGGESSIVRIDAGTGALTVISAGGNITVPASITVEADGNLLVSNIGSFIGGQDSIVRVDVATGAQTVLATGGSLNGGFGLGLGADGQIYAPAEQNSLITRINPVTGAQTVIMEDGLARSSRDLLVLNAPIVSTIAAQETDQNVAITGLAFSVWEPELPSDFLELSITSSNQVLVPDANLTISGSGPNRTLSITPAANKHGSANVTLTATNGVFTTTRVIPLVVHHVNQPPVAVNDNAGRVSFGQTVVIEALGNDSDVDEDPLTVVSVTVATFGTVELADGIISYTAGFEAGADSFSYVVQDPDGLTATATVTLEVVPPPPGVEVLLSKGGAVPGAGSAAGIPEGSVWATFGLPAINADGDIAVVGGTRSPAGTGRAIYKFSAATGAVTLIARVGEIAPDTDGATFGAFRDPLLADDGSMLFIAMLKGAGITSLNRAVVCWVSSAGEITLVARTGSPIASAGGASMKAFGGVDLAPGGHAAIRGPLHLSGNVTQANDTVALTWSGGAGLQVRIRKGTALETLGTVKAFNTMVAAGGAPGSGRGWLSQSGEGGANLNARVAFTSGAQSYVQVDAINGDLSEIASTGAGGVGVPALPEDSAFKSLGIPSFSAGGANAATFRASLAKSFSGIFDLDQSTGSSLPIHVVGQVAPGFETATVRSVKDPVLSADGSVRAWDGAVLGGGVTPANDRILYWKRGAESTEILAREGTQAAECNEGARWKGFVSLAAIGGDFGPVFTGALINRIRDGSTILPGPGGVTAADDIGLWAVDSMGALRLLLREGQEIGGETVKNFSVLKASSGMPGARRSFNEQGEVVVVVKTSNSNIHIVRITVP